MTATVITAVGVMIMSSIELRNIKKEFSKMRYQVAEYASDKDVEKFINTHKNFIENSKIKSVKAMARLNLAAAYADKGDYEESKGVLSDLDLKDFGKKNYLNAGLNKILIYYRVDDFKDGDEIFDEVTSKSKVNQKDPLYIITDTIRNYRGTEEGIRILSDLNMKEGIEPYRNLIQAAKLVVKRGTKCADSLE